MVEYDEDGEAFDTNDYEPDYEDLVEARRECRSSEDAWDRYHDRASAWESRFPI